ncbi:hypothetical protein F4703DRAFT_1879816 [Phycomyces blakesleeanus]
MIAFFFSLSFQFNSNLFKLILTTLFIIIFFFKKKSFGIQNATGILLKKNRILLISKHVQYLSLSLIINLLFACLSFLFDQSINQSIKTPLKLLTN